MQLLHWRKFKAFQVVCSSAIAKFPFATPVMVPLLLGICSCEEQRGLCLTEAADECCPKGGGSLSPLLPGQGGSGLSLGDDGGLCVAASLTPPQLRVLADGHHLLVELADMGPSFQFHVLYWKKGQESRVSSTSGFGQ